MITFIHRYIAYLISKHWKMKINLFNKTLEDSQIGDALGCPNGYERSSGVFYLWKEEIMANIRKRLN
jgi:hypothetical protein